MPLPAWGDLGRLDGRLSCGFTWSCFGVDRLDREWAHFCCPDCLEPLYLLTPEQHADARLVLNRPFRLAFGRRGTGLDFPGNPPGHQFFPLEPWLRDLFDALDRHACPD